MAKGSKHHHFHNNKTNAKHLNCSVNIIPCPANPVKHCVKLKGFENMANYIEKIFERADIRQICSFLLNGVPAQDKDERSYFTRLNLSKDKVQAIANEQLQDEFIAEKFMETMYESWNTYQNVYMEIGIKIGMKLASEYSNKMN